MAENRNTINIKSDESGEIKVADEVVAIIAGLAATEVVRTARGLVSSPYGIRSAKSGCFILRL